MQLNQIRMQLGSNAAKMALQPPHKIQALLSQIKAKLSLRFLDRSTLLGKYYFSACVILSDDILLLSQIDH